MKIKDFRAKTSQNRKFRFLWLRLVECEGFRVKNHEINTRNEELSMSRCAKYILKFLNSKNSKSYGFLKSAMFLKNQDFAGFCRKALYNVLNIK